MKKGKVAIIVAFVVIVIGIIVGSIIYGQYSYNNRATQSIEIEDTEGINSDINVDVPEINLD